MGVGYKAIAEAPVLKHMVCSTLTEPSGWVADRRLAFHAGRAVVIEQTQESWTEVCGMRSEGSPSGSWLRRP